ncbi:SMI1/KNR4 family protein [Ruegeria sp. 2012CJ41-6]|uniref:SMI1/KNR4 family protein n=1 Tax=Ruegeria spongiae TaxID=2942209 RepID=A0ABT0PX05_9RHOB|nr:SMI1/KNR4 family protein [Ruegeria spongiae]MCL6281907.1 SMI1/KNR4 family protein [Ruegeria spongiae]
MIFNCNNKPAKANEVREFEGRRGIRLPGEYVDFLLSQNGGGLNPEQSAAWIEGWNWLLVQVLFGLTARADASIATERFTNFSDFMHARMLKIGYDPFGQTLFMDLREGPNHGKIYIRAHNSPPNDPILIDDTGFEDEDDYEEAQLLYPVANSFSEFTAMLGPAPD